MRIRINDFLSRGDSPVITYVLNPAATAGLHSPPAKSSATYAPAAIGRAETPKRVTYLVTTASVPARLSATTSDWRNDLTCTKQTQSDRLRRNCRAWRAEGRGSNPLGPIRPRPPPGSQSNTTSATSSTGRSSAACASTRQGQHRAARPARPHPPAHQPLTDDHELRSRAPTRPSITNPAHNSPADQPTQVGTASLLPRRSDSVQGSSASASDRGEPRLGRACAAAFAYPLDCGRWRQGDPRVDAEVVQRAREDRHRDGGGLAAIRGRASVVVALTCGNGANDQPQDKHQGSDLMHRTCQFIAAAALSPPACASSSPV